MSHYDWLGMKDSLMRTNTAGNEQRTQSSSLIPGLLTKLSIYSPDFMSHPLPKTAYKKDKIQQISLAARVEDKMGH